MAAVFPLADTTNCEFSGRCDVQHQTGQTRGGARTVPLSAGPFSANLDQRDDQSAACPSLLTKNGPLRIPGGHSPSPSGQQDVNRQRPAPHTPNVVGEWPGSF